MKYPTLIFLIVTTLISINGQAKKSHDIVPGFLQIKDQLNLGMVFNCGQLEYRFGLQWTIQEKHEIFYQPKLGVAIGASRFSGMECHQIHIAPINLTWTMPVNEQIRAGANFITDYNYQLWEDLHDAPLFWNCEIGISPVISYSFQWDDKKIKADLKNSLLGFTSHRQGYDPYFWQKTFKDAFVKPHEDLKFGSFNNYNHTNVSIKYTPNISKRHTFGYEFDYLGLFYGSRFHRINHNLLWRIAL